MEALVCLLVPRARQLLLGSTDRIADLIGVAWTKMTRATPRPQ
jgi:hypothetical protein